MRNASMRMNSISSVFPTGVYKFIIYVFENDEPVITANIIASVTSPNKDTFG